jgi:rare lipoprotein A
MKPQRAFALVLLALSLAACGTSPKKDAADAGARISTPPADATAEEREDGPKRSPYAPAQEDPSKRGDYVAGGLYAPHIKDSVPDYVPNVDAIPEPDVKAEPRSRYGNRTYSVLGKTYRVKDSAEGYAEQGMASFYGKKFHGRLTSNQEVYDMYAFSAAHKSLPLPSYVRVTNLANGKSVVVRVNDRGPFHSNRIIDLSYAAAVKLDFIRQGTARVEVQALTPGERDDAPVLARRDERQRKKKPDEPPAPVPPTVVADNAVPADEFQRWMEREGVRFASGRSGEPSAPATGDAPAPVGQQSVAPQPADTSAARVLLQLAAYGSRDNAERARARLEAEGVDGVRVDEAEVSGQPVWRLRVGPVVNERVPELSERFDALGFGPAQIVRD